MVRKVIAATLEQGVVTTLHITHFQLQTAKAALN